MKFAVMGAGAVGCYFGALLARAGHSVRLIGRPSHVDAINQKGLRFESATFTGDVMVEATTAPNGVEGADTVLFCVKSADTETAGRTMAPFLKPTATVLSLQNGVDNAERLQAVLPQTVIPAVVYVATEMAGVGHVKHHGRGELIIGLSAASRRIAETLSVAGIPTTVSEQVLSALWVKLIANCSYNALSAVSQLPYGKLVAVDGTREVIRNIVDECVSVANAEGISIPNDIYDKTMTIAADMPHQYSSTAQDIVRGKPTEIDYLNGFIVRKGAQRAIPTPLNQLLLTMVKLKEATRQSEC
jgi:2-dehydropantoate 2-reductase